MAEASQNPELSLLRTNEPMSLAAKAAQAMALHGRGALSEARALYEEILAIAPGHFEALHLSGVIALESGDPRRAVELMSRSLEVNPANAIAHFNHGVALRALGDLCAALAGYDRAIARNPAFAAAHSNRGLVLTELGRLDAAVESFDRAVAVAPQFAEAHFNRGVALHKLGRYELAVASYDRAIQIRPDLADAHYNRGNSLLELNRLEEAADSFGLAVAADPGHVAAHINRGNALKDLEQRATALASYDSALALNPNDAHAHCNRGVLLFESNEVDAAVASFDRALALQPDFAAARQYRGYAYLLAGEFEKGWVDLESRWRNEHGPVAHGRRAFAQPLWLGEEAIAGKRILLHGEQGFGDTLQFCRYAEWVSDLGATVILEAPQPLLAVLQSLAGVAQLVAPGEALPEFDVHCPLMSLPLAFRTGLARIPARVPYLRCDETKARLWSERLGSARNLRVGLVWSGGFRPQYPRLWPINRRRNVPLEKLAPLGRCQAEFYSLQKGEPAESELAELIARKWNGPPLIDFSADLGDFSDTAALLEQLDLLISVDTAVAHLAGALGKPVWILNRFDNCWRWLRHRTDSPWYPTARLYRQPQPGDWDAVVSRVRDDLEVETANFRASARQER